MSTDPLWTPLPHIREVAHDLRARMHWELRPLHDIHPVRVREACELLSAGRRRIIAVEVDEPYRTWRNVALTQIGDVGIFRVRRGTPRLIQRVQNAVQLGHALLYAGFPDDRYRLPSAMRSTRPHVRLAHSSMFAACLLTPKPLFPQRTRDEMAAQTPVGRSVLALAAGNLDVPAKWGLGNVRWFGTR